MNILAVIEQHLLGDCGSEVGQSNLDPVPAFPVQLRHVKPIRFRAIIAGLRWDSSWWVAAAIGILLVSGRLYTQYLGVRFVMRGMNCWFWHISSTFLRL